MLDTHCTSSGHPQVKVPLANPVYDRQDREKYILPNSESSRTMDELLHPMSLFLTGPVPVSVIPTCPAIRVTIACQADERGVRVANTCPPRKCQTSSLSASCRITLGRPRQSTYSTNCPYRHPSLYASQGHRTISPFSHRRSLGFAMASQGIV